jgi:hypothetical protein
MGSVNCQLKKKLLEDPDVAMHADVGYTILTGLDHTDTNFTTLSQRDGLVYVKDGALHHEPTLRSKFHSRNMHKRSFQLHNIKRLEVVQGNITILKKKGHMNSRQLVPMKIGLRVAFKDNSTLVMEMPNAVNFCTQLNQYTVSYRRQQHEMVDTIGSRALTRSYSSGHRFTGQTRTRSATVDGTEWRRPHCEQNVYTTLDATATLRSTNHRHRTLQLAQQH